MSPSFFGGGNSFLGFTFKLLLLNLRTASCVRTMVFILIDLVLSSDGLSSASPNFAAEALLLLDAVGALRRL